MRAGKCHFWVRSVLAELILGLVRGKKKNKYPTKHTCSWKYGCGKWFGFSLCQLQRVQQPRMSTSFASYKGTGHSKAKWLSCLSSRQVKEEGPEFSSKNNRGTISSPSFWGGLPTPLLPRKRAWSAELGHLACTWSSQSFHTPVPVVEN